MELLQTNSKDNLRLIESKTDMKWMMTVIIVGHYVVSLYYFITFPYLEHKLLIIWTVFLIHVMTIGITAGVHRLWSHRSYKAKVPLRILLAVLYYGTGHSNIYDWVRDHRIHHECAEKDVDFHNSRCGLWHSHIGWLIMRKEEKVMKLRKEINMSDVEQDPVVKFFDTHALFMRIFWSFVIPIVVPIVFFNEDLKLVFICQVFLRYSYVLNCSFIINNSYHTTGNRTYDKSIRPTENVVISLLTAGEGWQNYHHVFPWDYKAAEFKNFLCNPTTLWIDMFAKIGWAYDLQYATSNNINEIVRKRGDGTHYTICKTADRVYTIVNLLS